MGLGGGQWGGGGGRTKTVIFKRFFAWCLSLGDTESDRKAQHTHVKTEYIQAKNASICAPIYPENTSTTYDMLQRPQGLGFHLVSISIMHAWKKEKKKEKEGKKCLLEMRQTPGQAIGISPWQLARAITAVVSASSRMAGRSRDGEWLRRMVLNTSPWLMMQNITCTAQHRHN